MHVNRTAGNWDSPGTLQPRAGPCKFASFVRVPVASPSAATTSSRCRELAPMQPSRKFQTSLSDPP